MVHSKARKWAAVAMLVLMFVASSVSVWAAVQGSEGNPLVTLSYLKNVFSKSILNEAEAKIAESKSSYEKSLDNKVTGFVEEMKNLAGNGGTSGAASFAVVDVPNGKSLKGSIGCEVMLRVGSAQCVSSGSPGLIDSTSGGTLENGGALAKNHLYLITLEGRSVKAVGGYVKLMVRGSYTIQ